MKKYTNFLSIVAAAVLSSPVAAFAAEGAEATGSHGMIAMGAGVAIGLAALGGTLGQSKAIAAALESIGRNPSASGKVFLPMILGLALIESLVILSFVIAIGLSGKV